MENKMFRASLICLLCVTALVCIGCESSQQAKRGTETIIPTAGGQGHQCIPFFVTYPENWEQAFTKNE